jgi:uncharacterized protein (DUF2147 family)
MKPTRLAIGVATLAMAAAASFASFATAASAQENSPVGVWKTIDDNSGKPRSLVRITENNGELRGKIEKLFLEPGENQNPVCEKCEGNLKDQPIVGMTILTGLKKDGDEYNGGKVLDPGNGKVYNSKLSLADGGKKLNMRGYIGMPMLGRTQTWIRVD